MKVNEYSPRRIPRLAAAALRNGRRRRRGQRL
jgi:hypothetical protein